MDYNTLNLSVIYPPKGRAAEYSPLACNLYLGCTHGCKYCYVPGILQKTMAQFHAGPAPRAESIFPKIEKDILKLQKAGIRIPVLFSFASDPYQPAEDSLRLMERAVFIFSEHDYPMTILSKAGMTSVRHLNYLPGGSQIAASLTFSNDADSLKWEPQAALPQERINALARAHEAGYFTWASLEPVIDPVQSLALIKLSAHAVDHYKIGTWNHSTAAGKLDYKSFGNQAIKLLEGMGKSYYIKEDLKRLL